MAQSTLLERLIFSDLGSWVQSRGVPQDYIFSSDFPLLSGGRLHAVNPPSRGEPGSFMHSQSTIPGSSESYLREIVSQRGQFGRRITPCDSCNLAGAVTVRDPTMAPVATIISHHPWLYKKRLLSEQKIGRIFPQELRDVHGLHVNKRSTS